MNKIWAIEMKRIKYKDTDEMIAKSNRLWANRKSSYERSHRYGGDPASVRWDEIIRPRIKQEMNLNDYSSYR